MSKTTYFHAICELSITSYLFSRLEWPKIINRKLCPFGFFFHETNNRINWLLLLQSFDAEDYRMVRFMDKSKLVSMVYIVNCKKPFLDKIYQTIENFGRQVCKLYWISFAKKITPYNRGTQWTRREHLNGENVYTTQAIWFHWLIFRET